MLFIKSKQSATDTERLLLQQLRSGSSSAVHRWFYSYHDRVLRAVSQKIADYNDAQEVTQEIFVSCLKHLPFFRGDSKIFTWMMGVAKHEVADYYRKKYAKRVLHTLPIGDLLLAAPIDDAHETAEQFRQVWQGLSSHHQAVLAAKYVDGKQVKDIALEFGRSIKSIESDLYRARKSFQTAWSAMEQISLA